LAILRLLISLVFAERLTKQRQGILDGIANNPQAPFKDRLVAHHLTDGMTVIIDKFNQEVPALMARRRSLPGSPLITEGSTALNVKMARPCLIAHSNMMNWMQRMIMRKMITLILLTAISRGR
jgi:hypothetical protein